MIALTYINKNSATIAAMKDYESMKQIIATTSQDVKDEYDDIISINSPSFDDMPKAHNPKAGENKLVSKLDKINIMRERYKQAIEYMAWFEPAWQMLNDNEKLILQEFYMNGNQRSGANARISVELGYSSRQIERFRHKGIQCLMLNLYGR
ncbi:ArpU family phage packaging/lysis transcriptional regulator [Clostridium sp. DL1XJH146]